MSILGDAVRNELATRGIELEQAQIDKALLDAGVSSTVSRGVPVRLRVRRVHVTGTKTYSENPEASKEMTVAPINLDWSPADGVNGVGSGANMRGKSSIRYFTMWALTGRCHLQDDVLSWVDHVQAEFHVDGVPLYVDFTVDEGEPAGTVEQRVPSGRAVLGHFSGSAAFESLMGSVMLERLRLDVISVFAKDQETEHAWPSYASALTVQADKLDPIIGNESTLKTRFLQMFIGTSWAAVDAQVATAVNARQFVRAQAAERRDAVASVSATALARAEERFAVATAQLDQYHPGELDVESVLMLSASATDRAREAQDIRLELMTASNAESQVRSHLRAEELRRQAAAEDAVARRLFNGMAPTVCPRCSTTVSAARYAAEATVHECSLCAADLVLDVREPSAAEGSPVFSTGNVDGGEDVGEEPGDGGVDAVEALRVAVSDAAQVVADLQAAFNTAEAARLEAQAAARRGRDALNTARVRRQAELELARAEGALEAMRGAPSPPPLGPQNDDDLTILETASKLTKRWLKEDQDPLLVSVSEAITALARRFGTSNIIAVHLKGNGNMDVEKGGVTVGYSKLTNGEKLRIKLAAAIALVQIGGRDGVGRHPGLLFVDSPAAEEIPESDLRTMLEAMTAVELETDLQIIVATRHGPLLRDVLPEDHLLVANGTDYLW